MSLAKTRLSRMSRIGVGLVGLPCMIMIMACGSDEMPSVTDLGFRAEGSILDHMVAEGVAHALSDEGWFQTPSSTVPGSADVRLATEVARDLFARFGPHFRPTLEAQSGRTIDFSRLEPMGRVFFSETPFEPLDPEEPLAIRAAFGSYYVVTFGYDSYATVSMAISEYASELPVVDGVYRMPPQSGNIVRIIGIDPYQTYGSPIAPEGRIASLLQDSGARLARVPRFIRQGWDWAPQYGSWLVELDRAIAVQSQDGSTKQTRALFLDRDGSWRLPGGIPAQPRLAGELPGRSQALHLLVKPGLQVPGGAVTLPGGAAAP